MDNYSRIVTCEEIVNNDFNISPIVMEWSDMHRSELMENWTTLAEEGIFKRIATLV